MRAIHVALLDKRRPVLVMTRSHALGALGIVTVAPITRRVRGLQTEVPVGPDNGLDQMCAVTCDNLITIPADLLGRWIGALLPEQEDDLTRAIVAAFDLLL